MIPFIRVSLRLFITLFLTSAAQATVFTWTGLAPGEDDGWDAGTTTTNWDQGSFSIPDFADDVIFSATAAAFSVDLAGNREVASVTFAGASGYSIYDDALTINSSTLAVDAANVMHTIASDINLDAAAAASWDIGANANLLVTGTLDAPNGLTKTGAGMLALNGDINLDGLLDVQEGVVGLGEPFSGNLNLSGGGVEVGHSYQHDGYISLSDTSRITISAGRIYTINGAITNSEASTLEFAGNGTTIITSANTYAGITDVLSGYFYVTNSSGSATGSSSVIIRDPVVLAGEGIIAGPVTVDGGDIRPGGSLTFGGLTMDALSRLFIDVHGPSDYETLVVNGAVDLGSIELNLILRYAPSLGDSFVVIENDGTDPITGLFTNQFVTSATYNSNEYYFRIVFDAGDGNDLGIVTINAFDYAMGLASLGGTDSAANATPFNDGVENVVKYAFNMDASQVDLSLMTPTTGTKGLPYVELLDSGILKLEYVRRINDSSLAYAPRWGTTLIGWNAFTDVPTTTPIDGEFERVLYEEPVNLSSADTYFVEVEVSFP